MRRAAPALGTYQGGTGAFASAAAGAKLLWLFSASLAALVAPPWFCAAVLVLGVVVARRSGIAWASLGGAVAPVAVILAFALVANGLVVDGSGDVCLVGPVGVSLTGLGHGGAMVLRICALGLWALLVASVTAAQEAVDSVTALLSPLAALGAPVTSWAMVLSLTLRFAPSCTEELGRLRDAQRARGANFDRGGPVARVHAWASVLVPLCVALFSRAQRSAESMADRLWGAPGRTMMRRSWTVADGFWAAGAVALLVAAFLVGR